MTTIPDVEETHKICDGVELVKWDPNPLNKVVKGKK